MYNTPPVFAVQDRKFKEPLATTTKLTVSSK